MIWNHRDNHTYHFSHHGKDVLLPHRRFELATSSMLTPRTVQLDIIPLIADSTRLNSTKIRTASSSGAPGSLK